MEKGLSIFMETRFAPWRMAYLKGEKPPGCIFCKDSARSDEFILLEGKASYVMLNLFPYNNGHLLIIPFRHVGQIEDLTPEEREEIFTLMGISVKALKGALDAEGFNIGMNLGRVAGAGVDDHLHVHVVPRWGGDTSYMSVVGEVRVIPEDLRQTWKNLMPFFQP